ncbi:unnamed protein product [Choristocarpus tenellus]
MYSYLSFLTPFLSLTESCIPLLPSHVVFTEVSSPVPANPQQSANQQVGGLAHSSGFHPRHTRYCSACRHSKPLRCHHCRVCKRCVLKMDHHCHWVGCCVGQRNYKAYLLTLFYSSIGSWSMLWLLFCRLREDPFVGWMQLGVLLVDGFSLAFLSIGLLYLLIWHAYLVSKNITTIEYYQVSNL